MPSALTRDRLLRAATAYGFEASGGEGPETRDGGADWRLARNQHGWLTITRAAEGYGRQEHLLAHADWAGPLKLMTGHGGPVERLDVLLGNQLDQRFDQILDPDADDVERALCDTLSWARAIFRREPGLLEGWEPPDAEQLSAWLAEGGRTVARDKDGNLRSTVRASNRDGQVRVYVAPGRLRMVLPLGTWSRLPAAAEAAMLRLADQANNRLRVVRIAWRATDGGAGCEAQADLTGLPWDETTSPTHGGVMREMLRAAIAGLELALRQLEHELEVLADPRYAGLAETVFFD